MQLRLLTILSFLNLFSIVTAIAPVKDLSDLSPGKPTGNRKTYDTDMTGYTWEQYKACRGCWQEQIEVKPEDRTCGPWCSAMRVLVE